MWRESTISRISDKELPPVTRVSYLNPETIRMDYVTAGLYTICFLVSGLVVYGVVFVENIRVGILLGGVLLI